MNPSNDDPQVIEPLDHGESGLGEFSSGKLATWTTGDYSEWSQLHRE